jgi:DNA-binding transcriptional regulator YiaG
MGRLKMTLAFRKIDGGKAAGKPLHYTACGLDDIYLVNGFTREVVDGEEYITIQDLDALWSAIGLHLVTTKKVLAPKEIRFLREHMDFTQAELGKLMRVSDQTVARWEKGTTDAFEGPADFMLRVLFLTSPIAQPEGREILNKTGIMKMAEEIVEKDEQDKPVLLRHKKRHWEEQREPVCACL